MEHTIALIQKSHDGDKAARTKLVEENMGLVWCVVRRFGGSGLEMDDLFQIGSIGLLKAIDKFDLTYDVKFSTYAVPMIVGEIRRFLRDDGMIKVSRSLKEILYKACALKEKMLESTGVEPGVEDLAREMNLSREDLIMALEAGSEVESLQKTIYQGDGGEILLMDRIAEDEKREDTILNQVFLRQMMEGLDEKEKQLLCLRYFENKTQGETGAILGISQVQVSRLEKKILLRLRDEYHL